MVLEAVKQNGWMLEYASEVLKADKQVVLEAVNECGSALSFASEELKRPGAGSIKSYVHGLHAIYNTPARTFFSTIIMTWALPTKTEPPLEEEQPPPPKPRARVEDKCGLRHLNLGGEGGVAIVKDIAAYAGVRCAMFVGLPWSTVMGARDNLA